MKKTQMALAAVALVASTAAMADGVTISGRFDMGVQNGAADGKTLSSGLLAPNFLNVGASEDLGNGMKATAFLSTIVGQPGFNTSSLGFAQSNIGLSGDFGGIKLGQMVDSLAGTALGFDVTGGQNIGSLVTALFQHTATGVFHDKAVQYNAPTIGGVNAGVTYLLENGTSAIGDTTKGDYSLGASTDVGMARLGVGYSSYSANKAYFIGVGTDIGSAKVNLVYLSSNAVGGTSGASANTVGVNTQIPVTDALAARVAYYTTDGSTINGSNTVLGALYSLSAKTQLFANYEKVTGAVVINGGNGGTDTATNRSTVGISTSF